MRRLSRRRSRSPFRSSLGLCCSFRRAPWVLGVIRRALVDLLVLPEASLRPRMPRPSPLPAGADSCEFRILSEATPLTRVALRCAVSPIVVAEGRVDRSMQLLSRATPQQPARWLTVPVV